MGSYLGDVWYAAWRSGRNPDYVDDERVMDMKYAGYSAEEAAASEISRMRNIEQEREYNRQQEEEMYAQEQYYAEQPGN